MAVPRTVGAPSRARPTTCHNSITDELGKIPEQEWQIDCDADPDPDRS